MKLKTMLVGVLALSCACAFGGETKENAVAQKLQTCDFLLNKDFKRNAKYYLCLFSASWCGPCRREMPRIAKTYAEQLKSDPNIELIHFSRDQNDEKALAWAKEHDVKFPVVKPQGGNPLELHSRGIPHLFIVKADGTQMAEGHPMRLFTDENLRALKAGKIDAVGKPKVDKGENTETVGGYTWTYRLRNGGAEIIAAGGARRCTVSPTPKGHVVIPSTLGGVNVTKIGGEAFCGCSEMSSVDIPASVTEICWRAFGECGSLASVHIPAGVATIRSSAFSSCGRLTSISVSAENEHYTALDGILFDKGMKTLICYPGGIAGSYLVPDGVTEIDSNAFSGNRGVTSVSVPDSVTSIGEFAFSQCRELTSVTLGSGVKRMGQAPFYWCSGLKSINVSEANCRYSSLDGVLFDKDKTTLICCPGGVSGEYKIPSTIRTIGSYAFDSCKKLSAISIPSSVMRIERNAFNYCTGLAVTIPSSVNYVGDWAFCRAANSVAISDGVKTIGTGTFCQCSALTSVVIPASVTSVGKYAFSGCNGLTSVTMLGERPESQEKVFDGCKKLIAIHVPANAKSWAGMKEWQGKKLVFDARNENLQNAQTASAASEQQHNTEIEELRQQMKEMKAQLETIKAQQKSSGKTTANISTDNTNRHAAVELGGVQLWEDGPFWAECNVGATRPEEFGYYFRWGDTVGYNRDGNVWVSSTGVRMRSYPFGESDCGAWNKSNSELLSLGYIDSSGNLVAAHDAATAHLGAPWRTPTETELSALVSKCDSEWVAKNGVYGRLVRGRGEFASQSIFLPAAGIVPAGGVLPSRRGGADAQGYYWPSSSSDSSRRAKFLMVKSKDFRNNQFGTGLNCSWGCMQGQSIRPVRGSVASSGRGVRSSSDGRISFRDGSRVADKVAQKTDFVAEKLQTCDFLLNKDFKRNAKYYLCLFSASWCGPCRREMPRIAKTYAEQLKADPNIELIHFSRDQNDEKALAWAKEHDVKFPVVKPQGGNPLDLHSRGIPHLFIVKADGTQMAEGHPIRLFTDENLRSLKGGTFDRVKNSNLAKDKGAERIGTRSQTNCQITNKYPNLQTNVVDGVSWLYVDTGRTVSLVGAASPLPQNLVMPSEIDGKRVMKIEEKAFEGCEEIVTLETPNTVVSIGEGAFSKCPNLESVRILSGSVRWSVFRGCPKLESVFVGEKVRSLEYGSLANCENLTSVTIEEGAIRLQLQNPFEGDHSLTSLHLPARYDGTESWCHGAFGDCSGLTKLTITEGNRYCRAENGVVLTADGKTLLAVASGLSSIIIPDSVETIPYRAIKGCNQIRELIIPDSVKTICAQGIGECSNLETLIIGSGVECIQSPKRGNSLFYQCPRLTTIRFLGNAPFRVDNLIYQAVSPALVTYIAKGTTGWNRDDDADLPALWPTNGVYGRKIAYWGDKSVKPFEPEGPYGIHMQPEPGCEDGADYVLGKLNTVYLPRAVRYYGDPFDGKKPTRIYTITVRRNDKGMSYGPGTGGWSIGLAKDRDTYEFSLDYLASSVLTVCEDANWASFVFYVNKFVKGDAEGRDPVPELKRDIEKGLSKDAGERNSWYRAHAPLWAALEELRENHPDFILKYCKLKNQRFAEGKLPAKLSALQMAKLMGEVTGENAVEIFARYGLCSEGGAATKLKKSNCPPKTNHSVKAPDTLIERKDSAKCVDSKLGMTEDRRTVDDKNPNLSSRRKKLSQKESRLESETVDGVTWYFSRKKVADKVCAEIVSGQNKYTGDLKIPSSLGGIPVAQIGMMAFGFSPITSVTIPASVTNVDEFTFDLCRELIAIRVDDDSDFYTSQDGILYNKTRTKLISCPRGKTGTVAIPSGVKNIVRRSFAGCRKIKDVLIPASVEDIGRAAFRECSSLHSFSVDDANVRFSSRNGLLCSKDGTTIYFGVNGSAKIPASVMEIEQGAFDDLMGLVSFSVDPANGCYSSRNGLLCTKDGSTLIAGVNGDVKIPTGVTEIGSTAFFYRKGLTAVTIPLTVKRIGRGAFAGCEGLNTVMIPASVQLIEQGAFHFCGALTSLTIPSTVTNIDRTAFDDCAKLKSVNVVKDGKTETVPFAEFCKERDLGQQGLGSLRQRRLARQQRPQPTPSVDKQLDAEREEQRRQLLDLQAQLKELKALKAEQERMKAEKSSGK